MSRSLIALVKSLPRVNSAGVQKVPTLMHTKLWSLTALLNRSVCFKLVRDVYTLQQTLTAVVPSGEQHFDRVRQYYGLLTLTDEVWRNLIPHFDRSFLQELLSYFKTHEHAFSFDEYRAVLELITPASSRTKVLEVMARLRSTPE